MPKMNEGPLSIGQIESIVASCHSFARIEQASTSDLDLWGHYFSADERADHYYVFNNARRILDIISVLREWKGMVPSASKMSRSPKLLEVGLGYGEVALSIAKAFPAFTVYGVEHPSRRFFMAAPYLSAMEEAKVTVIGADLDDRRLPFDDESFDAVLFCEVLEHLSPVQVPNVISELSRIVKVGGAVIVASPNLVSLYNRLQFSTGVSVFTPAIPLDYAGGTFGHIRLYSVRELENLASRSGLSLQHVRFSNSMLVGGTETKLHSILVKRVQIALSYLIPALANGWTALLTKNE